MAQLQVWRADVETPFRQTDTVELRDGESYQVGRQASSALLLRDSRVSGRHCVFTAVAGGMSVCDHSTNGTYLNGKRLEKGAPLVLTDGDVVVPLVPVRTPPTEGSEPRADLVVALVYRVAVAAPPCGLPPAGEASAQGSADPPGQPPDLASSPECAVRSSPPDAVEPLAAPPAELPAKRPATPPPEPPAAPPARPPVEPPSKPPSRPPSKPPSKPPAQAAKPSAACSAAAKPSAAKPSAAFDFDMDDMDEPAPPPKRRRSDGGPGSGGGSGAGSTGGWLSKAKRRSGGDACAGGGDAEPVLLSGGRRTSTTLKGDVLGFLRDVGS